MKPARKRKLTFLCLMILILGVIVALVLFALRQNISLFYSPSQVAMGQAPSHHPIRIGGMVVKGSISRKNHDLSVQFKITDYRHTVKVNYRGILPDLFREGQGIVAYGHLLDQLHFEATEVLAKHDEKYMPPEVTHALNQTSQTRNDKTS